jgi:HSP20 family protein
MPIVAFARWDPLRDLLALQERFERLTDAGQTGWTPPVDLYETADRFVLAAELPGLAREDIDIQFHDGTLILQGQRKEAPVPCEQYHRVERGHGAFARRFALPSAVAADRITADFRDGVLTIVIPKSPAANPRRIEVS